MLNSFVLCCNFCACKCECTVGVWSPRGGWGTVFPGVGNDKGGGGGVKPDVRELCPSTTGPLLPTMTDSLLAPGRQEVLYKRCPSQRSLSQIGLPLLPVPRTRKAPSPGSMFTFPHEAGPQQGLLL